MAPNDVIADDIMTIIFITHAERNLIIALTASAAHFGAWQSPERLTCRRELIIASPAHLRK